MANSEFSYVRAFELPDSLPPAHWIVIRIDGRGFSKLSTRYAFRKPNDRRALELMNACAVAVVRAFPDVVCAYGQSDEYSFVLHENTNLFDRRAAKLATSVATQFTAEYCMLWEEFMGGAEGESGEEEEEGGGGGDEGLEEKKKKEKEKEMEKKKKKQGRKLERPWPTFDGRCVCYPKKRILRDYLAWRQADCHVNNLYNTTFWNLVERCGWSGTQAELELKGTLAKDKNEILFARFGMNYNNEEEIYRKGTVVYRAYDGDEEKEEEDSQQMGEGQGEREQKKEKKKEKKKVATADPQSKSQMEKEKKRKQKARIVVEHTDIIGDAFWKQRPYILAAKRGEDGGE